MKSITFDSRAIIIDKKVSPISLHSNIKSEPTIIRINHSIILRNKKLRPKEQNPKINRKKKKKMIKPKFFKRETRRRRRKDRMIKSRIKSRAQVRPEFEARSEFASAFNEAVLYRRWQHRGEVENPKVARARWWPLTANAREWDEAMPGHARPKT